MRISDWSSDVCSSDLSDRRLQVAAAGGRALPRHLQARRHGAVQGGYLWLISSPFAMTKPHRNPLSRWSPFRASPTRLLSESNQARTCGNFCLTSIEIGRASCRERVWQYVEIPV